MSEFEYVFDLCGPLPEEFPAQREDLAELISELGGRKYLPKTWKLVDWLRTRPKAAPEILEKRKKHRAVLGLLTLLLALFALGPAVTAPKELLSVLLTGAVCLGIGIVFLWKCHRILLAVPTILAGFFYGIAGLGGRENFWPLLLLSMGLIALAAVSTVTVSVLPKKKLQDSIATKDIAALFECRNSAPKGHPIRIRFTLQGMEAMGEEGKSEKVTYAAITGILETEDLLAVVLGRHGFLLAKSELVQGAFCQMKNLVSQQTLWISAHRK